jgi:hypothetical protein
MRPRGTDPANLGPGAELIPPSSSCPRYARIVFANRENTARKSGAATKNSTDIAVGDIPTGIAVTPNGKTAYITNQAAAQCRRLM